jgi:hypothetical protein
MNARHASRNTHASAKLLAATLLVAHPVFAQRTHPPTLDEILQRLENNLHDYDTKVPSFFCDEHVVSYVYPGNRQQNTITDSVFRLKRVLQPDHTSSLEESRSVNTVNGKAPTSQDLSGPTVLSGAFEGGLAVVSLSQRYCMNYKLDRIRTDRPPASYVVRLSTDLNPPKPADCLLQESTKGQAILDPATLEITRLELTTPHHVIFSGLEPGSGYEQLKGERLVTVDYAPVQLDNRVFWMPATITSRVSAGANTFHPTTWSFKATYRNYHKLEVTSRILPADNAPAP